MDRAKENYRELSCRLEQLEATAPNPANSAFRIKRPTKPGRAIGYHYWRRLGIQQDRQVICIFSNDRRIQGKKIVETPGWFYRLL